MSGAAQSQFAPLGFLHTNPGLVGYTLQDRASAARTMLAREQQAAAILGGYQQAATFPSVGTHHASFLGGGDSTSALLSQLQPTPVENTGGGQNAPTVSKEKLLNQKQSSEESDAGKRETRIDATLAVNSSQPGDQPRKDAVQARAAKEDQDRSEQKPSATASKNCGSRSLGMTFVAPDVPAGLSTHKADQIRSSKFHRVRTQLDPSEYGIAVEFLLSAGAAVPIPKGLVLGPLKERLNTPGFKSAGVNSAPPISREVIAAAILIWLWATHEPIFRAAFEKNGRIDVDPECKWLVQTAVDTAVCELSLEIAESMAHGEGAFAEASAARKAAPPTTDAATLPHAETTYAVASRKLDVCTASIVCGALSVEMYVADDMNSVIPKYSQLVEYLDEARLGALRAKSQERALLASLIARMTIMTENFAQAYVSAMVRAGEALGHGRLFEVAQDEEVASSTMIPYDIFIDENGAWEDPCKPDDGFTPMMTGDDLMRRSHARAMIQKSLRKLQDRNHIRGGTPIYGPFVEPSSGTDPAVPANAVDTKEQTQTASPRAGAKRRMVHMNEPAMAPGSGSAAAKSWAVYNPKHICRPLDWDPDELENSPYGLHPRGDRMRAGSVAAGRSGQFMDVANPHGPFNIAAVQSDLLLPSTVEIDWVELASIFQNVEVTRKASRYRPAEPEKPTAIDGVIYAPSCRELQGELSTDSAESDTEEDLSEEATLASHQVVLDSMKSKLEAFLEARKKQQERRKNRQVKC
jgi:hypothetical protein